MDVGQWREGLERQLEEVAKRQVAELLKSAHKSVDDEELKNQIQEQLGPDLSLLTPEETEAIRKGLKELKSQQKALQNSFDNFWQELIKLHQSYEQIKAVGVGKRDKPPLPLDFCNLLANICTLLNHGFRNHYLARVGSKPESRLW